MQTNSPDYMGNYISLPMSKASARGRQLYQKLPAAKPQATEPSNSINRSMSAFRLVSVKGEKEAVLREE